MDKNKKKKIIHTVLASTIIATTAVTTTALLTSCNFEIAKGSPNPEQDNTLQDNGVIKNPGYSNFIDNIEQNDLKQLDKIAEKPLVPDLAKNKPKGTDKTVKHSKAYFMQSKMYKDAVQKQKNRLYEICQQYAMNKINSIFEDDKNDYKLFANVIKKGDTCSVVYQISKKPFGEIVDDDEEQQEEILRTTQTNSNEAIPYIALQYTFDLKNIKFDINYDSYLVVSGIESTAKYDFNGSVADMPEHMKIDLNNKQDIFNTHFENINLGSTHFEQYEEWNKQKLTNSSFLNSVLTQVRDSARTKIENIRELFTLVYDLLVIVKSNPKLADFLISVHSLLPNILSKLDVNPNIVKALATVLNPNTKIGSPNTSDPNTLFAKLIKFLEEKKLDKATINSVKSLFSSVDGNQHPIYWIFDLPVKLSKIPKEKIEAKVNSLGLILRTAIKKLAKTIDSIYNKVMTFGSYCPYNNIGQMRILDLIWGDSIKRLYGPKITNLILSNANGKTLEKLRNLKPILNQFSFNSSIMSGIIDDFLWVTEDYKDKLLSKWPKPNFKKKFPIKDFFKRNSYFSIVHEDIRPNSDGQSFSIDATYRLNFNKRGFIELTQWSRIMNEVKLKEFLKAINAPIKIGRFKDLYELMPDFFTITEGDYIEYKVKDDRAFIMPTTTGYQIKAKQDFQMNLKKTNKSVFFDFRQDVPFDIGEAQVAKALDPYEKLLDNYYLSARMSKNFVKDVNLNKSILDFQEYSYEGYEIDPSTKNLDTIKEIMSQYVRDNVYSINSSLNFVNDINDSTKDKILQTLGLDPKIFRSKAKFILTMKPGFSTKASTWNAPKMSNINLDIVFNVPIINKKPPLAKGYKWTNNIKITNIKY